MTTEQAVKAIESHLDEYIDEIPKKLLDKISDIINCTRLIIRKEIILVNRQKSRDLLGLNFGCLKNWPLGSLTTSF